MDIRQKIKEEMRGYIGNGKTFRRYMKNRGSALKECGLTESDLRKIWNGLREKEYGDLVDQDLDLENLKAEMIACMKNGHDLNYFMDYDYDWRGWMEDYLEESGSDINDELYPRDDDVRKIIDYLEEIWNSLPCAYPY